MKTVTLLKTIPSKSHNSPFNPDIGHHWPAGQQFRRLPKYRQNVFNQTLFEQIGGEEVLLLVPNSRIAELFGNQSGNAASHLLIIIFAVIGIAAVVLATVAWPSITLLGTLAQTLSF